MMCVVSAQSSWEVAQSSCDVCHVSAQSGYNVYHVSAQSSWEVAQGSYDECRVSAQSSLGVAQSSYVSVMFQLRAAWK